MKVSIGILRNESSNDHLQWVQACQRRLNEVDFEVLDITKSGWLAKIREKKLDLFLLRPPGRTEKYKQLYDERSFILYNYSGIPIYPSLIEVLIYENKRFLRDWLSVNNVPSPFTEVFYSTDEALNFIKATNSYPIVGKTNIGASGNGVVFLQNRSVAEKYVNRAFQGGIKTRTGPKISKGSLVKKLIKAFTYKKFITNRLKEYRDTYLNPQKDYVIFQEYVPHDYEWRCVRIGDSYFAHKKIARNNKSSGTLLKGYDPVPLDLLDFILDITERTHLSSVAIDLFQRQGKFLVNEIQCFFGQSDPYQMLVNSKPGRYRRMNGNWVFEEGDFASNECFDLRLEHALKELGDTPK